MRHSQFFLQSAVEQSDRHDRQLTIANITAKNGLSKHSNDRAYAYSVKQKNMCHQTEIFTVMTLTMATVKSNLRMKRECY
ncbi:hypothetical protein DOY81_009176 [Sarcophaga bullata]|nr:hypothetical protein DOY81_009176 [Sarcophaga bullata]